MNAQTSFAQALVVPPAPPARPDYSFAAVVGLAIIAVAAAFWLTPSPHERADVLLAKGQPGKAADLLQAEAGARALLPPEIQSLTHALIASGRETEALPLLERAFDQSSAPQPDLKLMARLYHQAGDYRREAQVLERDFHMTGDTTLLDRLRVIYRLIGARLDEARILDAMSTAGLLDHAGQERIARLHTDQMATTWVARSSHFAALLDHPVTSHVADATEIRTAR